MNMVWNWPAVLLASPALAALVMFTAAPTPIRLVVMLWFVLVCPGMALVRLLGIEDSNRQLVLAVALSLLLESAMGTTMIFTNTWSPTLGLGVMAGVCVLGVVLQLTPLGRTSRESWLVD